MTYRRFWLLIGLTAAACILFLAGDDFMALTTAAAILVISLESQRRRQS
jgi:hypothetical protein